MDKISLTAIFLASLAGSLHCVGMCGGFVVFCTASGGGGKAHLTYNFGRFSSYVFLGGLAGWIGQFGNKVSAGVGISHGVSIILACLIVGWGIGDLIFKNSIFSKNSAGGRIINLVRDQFSSFYKKALSSLPSGLGQRAFIVGLLSALLPCGWLYAYVAIATTTGSPLYGMASMAAFWLGTVPALIGVGWLSGRLSDKVRSRLPILTTLLIIFAAIFSLFTHIGVGSTELFDNHHSANDGPVCH